ncbi:MAG: DUF1559 domain-containing protein [Planctomycetales bacterium]|nr:DUF1559 domain-containing protein [Planctomycetales bacterium]
MSIVANLVRRKKTVGFGLLLGVLVGLAGCSGGSMSADDMRKYAIKRTSDPEEETPPAVAAKSNAPAKAKAAQPASEDVDATNVPAGHSPVEVASASPRDAKPVDDQDAQAEQQSPSSASAVSDTRQPPAAPLSAPERAQIAADNIEQIAAALDSYLENRNKYPGYALTDGAGTPLLSWRVALLPYLGHKKLYGRFKLDEPWNSPTNRKLLKLIPAAYQSPERFDENTNFLAPIGGATALGTLRGVNPRRMEDGPQHTVFVVEVDDEHAVPWTKPDDFQYDPRQDLNQFMGALRGGHFLAAWGGGMAGAVPLSAPRESLLAMFTIDGGENFSAYSVSMPLDKTAIAKLAGGAAAPVAVAAAPTAATTTVGAPPNAAASSAPATTPFAGGGAVAPANGLGQEYLSAAQAAWRLQRTGDALRWLLAADVASRTSRQGLAFAWIAALRRPCATVHIGIGVRSDKPVLAAAGAASGRRGVDPFRQRTQQAVGAPGGELLELLDEYAAAHAPASLGGSVDPASDQPARGAVSYLGAGSRSELTQVAVENAVDVLVLFNADSGRGGRSVACELFDVARGDSLLALPRIEWTDDDAGRRALARDDDFRETKWRLQDFLADRLTPQPLPESLRPRHAVARMTALGDAKTLHPLAALAEMVAYRRLGLVSDMQLLDGMRGLLGAEAGETLMLGSERRQQRLFRQWLPTDDASEMTKLVEQAQRRRQDEDN